MDKVVNLSDIDSSADENVDRDIDFNPVAKKIKREDLFHYEKQKQKKQLKKVVTNTKIQPKRNRPRPDRFGKRASTHNHDKFFSNLENNRKKISDFSEPPLRESLIVVETNSNGWCQMDSAKYQANIGERENYIAKSTCTSIHSLQSKQSNHESRENHENTENQANHANQRNQTENHEMNQPQAVVSDFLKNLENTVLEKFKQLDSGIECLRVHVARLEVKLSESHSMSLNQNNKSSSNCTETPESIGLPIRTKSDLDCFEDGLKDSEFNKKVVNEFFIAKKAVYSISFCSQESILSMVRNNCGHLKGDKVSPYLFNTIFAPSLQSLFTWTGKSSSKGEKKFGLKNLKKIIDVIFKVTKQVDASYTELEHLKVIKYKIIKYAYLHRYEGMNWNRFKITN